MEDQTINYSFIILAGILGLAFSTILLGPFIEFLKENLIGQYIREDGPQEHQFKKGTPTMGGVAILASIIASSVLVLYFTRSFNLEAMLTLLILTAFGLLGFSDDYLKVVKKHNKGLTGWSKLLFQGVLALIVTLFVFYMLHNSNISIFGITSINLSYFFILFGILVIVGSSNAVNLTDGVDGLAGFTSAISFFTLSFFLYKLGNIPLALIAASIGGSCVGFLFYNYHPAKIFMGDTGSLMLGGTFGMLGVLGGLELWLVPIGIIFVIESLSVIIQVISFKSTGKRVFKMTPIHHHFELCGDKEQDVVLKFSAFQAIFCFISVILGYVWLF